MALVQAKLLFLLLAVRFKVVCKAVVLMETALFFKGVTLKFKEAFSPTNFFKLRQPSWPQLSLATTALTFISSKY